MLKGVNQLHISIILDSLCHQILMLCPVQHFISNQVITDSLKVKNVSK
jgi:hypothetical protein